MKTLFRIKILNADASPTVLNTAKDDNGSQIDVLLDTAKNDKGPSIDLLNNKGLVIIP